VERCCQLRQPFKKSALRTRLAVIELLSCAPLCVPLLERFARKFD